MTHYDDPAVLAEIVAGSRPPLLVGLDVDGVLAPLVDHADDATLLDGTGDVVHRLAEHPGVDVAALSGRSLAGLEQFGFGEGVHVIGSHGMEWRSADVLELQPEEQHRLDTLVALAEQAADSAGAGAWVEYKPASVVLHIRQADAHAGTAACEELERQAGELDGVRVKRGQSVLELLAREGDKGSALRRLAHRLGAHTVVFAGDDVTDEDAFAALDDGDVAIKIGDADTIAPYRLRDPEAVRAWLHELDRLLDHGR